MKQRNSNRDILAVMEKATTELPVSGIYRLHAQRLILAKILDEIARRDLSSVSTERLLEVQLKYAQLLKDMTTGPTYMDQEDMVW